ncbi:MAG: hypothetical protein PHQ75_10790 [Thermoguttaceae bacterium]|nr:hypothetical protein [Thermoguttaceae bacterium]
MTVKHIYGLILLGTLVFVLGCGQQGNNTDKTDTNQKQDAPAQTQDATKLNIESNTTPEGVTHHFFKAFFSGDDKSAFALLTKKAQTVTKEKFSAQASDTIKWKVRKTTGDANLRQVYVEVEDLNEEGNASREELVFAVKKVDDTWGVSGFSTNGLSVDFEESKAQTTSTTTESNVQVGQVPTAAKPLK